MTEQSRATTPLRCALPSFVPPSHPASLPPYLPPCSDHKGIVDINKNVNTYISYIPAISSSHIIIIIIIIIIMNRISLESWAHQSFPELCDCWPWFSPAFTAYYMCFSASAGPLYLPSYPALTHQRRQSCYSNSKPLHIIFSTIQNLIGSGRCYLVNCVMNNIFIIHSLI